MENSEKIRKCNESEAAKCETEILGLAVHEDYLSNLIKDTWTST